MQGKVINLADYRATLRLCSGAEQVASAASELRDIAVGLGESGRAARIEAIRSEAALTRYRLGDGLRHRVALARRSDGPGRAA